MNDSHIVSISQIKEFLKVAKDIEFKGAKKKEKYEWIENILIKFRYFSLKKKDKNIVKNYLILMTGYSDAQITRLIKKKRKFGKIFADKTSRHRFPKIYTPQDVGLLIKTDQNHDRLSGPATKKIFEREFTIFKKPEFEKLNSISVSHIYNLRGTRHYQSNAKFFVKTRPTKVNIGERRKPDSQGEPGYLRVDSVHQGDLDKEKGVYHINLADEITQWEIVGSVEKISERYLEPLLKDLILQFPFIIKGFHSDNGSEFLNKIVAALLNKLLIKQTKSRSRHCNDNALVEGKNGSIIRKHMGYIHIPQRHADLINRFYEDYLNVYLNYHRPCGFATVICDKKGKQKKVYNTYQTPYEKLKSLKDADKYLKPDITFDSLDKIAYEKSDNEFAALMQKAKEELFKNFKNHNNFKGQKLQLPMAYTTFISGSYVD
ncbi:integrase [Patescibacteria group bacterium]|nr:integrase [Patescibacteria group bacterium]